MIRIPILTIRTAEALLRLKDGNAVVSLDLGRSKTNVLVENGHFFIGNQRVPLSSLKKIKEKSCYIIENGKIRKLAVFSHETNLYYKLFPTRDWPTVTLSSTPMHRFTFVSPKKDTESKIREISPVRGIVLDTCCGLGYTAIMAAEKADKVMTFERDEGVIEIAAFNPYSQELFANKKLGLVREDVNEGIRKLGNWHFDRIIHDPPTFRYSPELYSKEFHLELFRVMKKNGILYHYCPSPHITRGKLLYPRIIRQLKEAGFDDVKYHEVSSGIRAIKG
ncbi:SAM-dependent methyltransferase [Candidatus Woesearchaeota archaeon]|nr:SAM-dependent methyltransferase [Candidatus Woesearchaeota archaeon]